MVTNQDGESRASPTSEPEIGKRRLRLGFERCSMNRIKSKDYEANLLFPETALLAKRLLKKEHGGMGVAV